MSFIMLSESEESVLKEILDNLNENGYGDIKHWDERFDKANDAEDIRLRSIFKKLKDYEMIDAQWASNTPYYLTVLDNGLSYFDNKKAFLKEQKRLSHREWKIAIISGLIGAIVGLVPDIIELIRGYLNAG